MKVSEIELQMNRNLMAAECDVRTCVLSVYYIDTVYNQLELTTNSRLIYRRVLLSLRILEISCRSRPFQATLKS
jgi:hypothetical protein